MNTFRHNNTEHLRETPTMLAYLHDELKLEEAEAVEQLMEEDPLYRLAMDELHALQRPLEKRLPQGMAQTEAQFAELLRSTSQRFGAQLEAPEGGLSPSSGKAASGRRWRNYLLIAGGAVALALLIALPFVKQARLYEPPETQLVPDGDVYLAQQTLDNCGSRAIGQGKTITLYTAMVEHFAAEDYGTASQQLAHLLERGELSGACEARLTFYLAESQMARGEYEAAKARFYEVVTHVDSPEAIKNASHWYLANLALAQEAPEQAHKHFSILLDAKEENHLEALLAKGYLQDAQAYMAYLNEILD